MGRGRTAGGLQSVVPEAGAVETGFRVAVLAGKPERCARRAVPDPGGSAPEGAASAPGDLAALSGRLAERADRIGDDGGQVASVFHVYRQVSALRDRRVLQRGVTRPRGLCSWRTFPARVRAVPSYVRGPVASCPGRKMTQARPWTSRNAKVAHKGLYAERCTPPVENRSLLRISERREKAEDTHAFLRAVP